MELRTEIIEAQKARSDLFKWKIILVATLGAVALGLGPKDILPPTASAPPRFLNDYLLCIIPFVCLYVDILCSHMNLRMLVIGHYLRLAHLKKGEPNDAEYEDFAQAARAMKAVPWHRAARQKDLSAYALEDLVQNYSTVVFCLLVCLWGIVAWYKEWAAPLPFIITGLAGMAATRWQSNGYRRRVAALDALVEKPHRTP
jgi:hypothetical protein